MATRSRQAVNLSAGKARSATYGSGGSGVPLIRELVHGSRFGLRAVGAGFSDTALAVHRGVVKTRDASVKVARKRVAVTIRVSRSSKMSRLQQLLNGATAADNADRPAARILVMSIERNAQ